MTPAIWIALSISFAGIMLWLAVKSIQWAKKGTKGAAMLATIAFPDPDQPAPQQQVEEEMRRKKEAGSGRPK